MSDWKDQVWMRRLDEPDIVRVWDGKRKVFIDVPVDDLVKMVARDPVLRAAVLAALLPVTGADLGQLMYGPERS